MSKSKLKEMNQHECEIQFFRSLTALMRQYGVSSISAKTVEYCEGYATSLCLHWSNARVSECDEQEYCEAEITRYFSPFIPAVTRFWRSSADSLFNEVEFIDGVCMCEEFAKEVDHHVFTPEDVAEVCCAASIVYKKRFLIAKDYIDELGHHHMVLTRS